MKHSTGLQIAWMLIATTARTVLQLRVHAFVIHHPHNYFSQRVVVGVLGPRPRHASPAVQPLFDAAAAAKDESINNSNSNSNSNNNNSNNSLEQSREEIDDYRRSTGISNLRNGNGNGRKKVRQQ